MANVTRVVAPLLNVNEPAARVVEVAVTDGDRVETGAVLCALETTKAAAEVTAPSAGFVRRLSVAVGDSAAPDQLICLITATATEPLPVDADDATAPGDSFEVPAGMRLTKPALALAREHRVNLAGLPLDRVITGDDIRSRMSQTEAPVPTAAEESPSPDSRVVIFGGGGHGRTIIDMITAMSTLAIAGVIDDALPAGSAVSGHAVLGARSAVGSVYAGGIRRAANAVGGIRDMRQRVDATRLLSEAGFSFPALRHPRATVERSAIVAEGSQLMANAYVGSAARVGRHAIINTGSIVSHDCVIGEFAHIAPGAILAGDVHVGARALVGMGVSVSLGVRIGDDARIGNGAVVNADVPAGGIVAGGAVWPLKK